MTWMQSVCVFSGSNVGARPDYVEAARALGSELASRQLRMVYGGAAVGLMGEMATAALAAGGEVIGVIPRHLVDVEIAHKGLSDLRVTDSMHARKALMSELSDGFVALPGGYGTLEEFAEVVTWSQLGLQSKPCGLLDIAGFYSRFLGFLDHAESEQFIKAEHRQLVLSDIDPAALLDRMETWVSPATPKWIKQSAPSGE